MTGVQTCALPISLSLSQGSVRRALELVSGEGIGLYEDIISTFTSLPDLDGAKLHKQVERLAGVGDAERLELYLALLLAVMERLVRHGATEEGTGAAETEIANRLVSKANLAEWAKAWETLSEARAEAFAFNLDRSLLVLDSWFRLQKLVGEHPV